MRKSTIKTAKQKEMLKASSAKKAQLKKAQDAGGLSNVAVSHVSKETILKEFKDKP
jgi:hypothetical protein